MGGSDAGRLDWANTLGTTGGTQTHTLTGAESGTSSHTHSINHDHASFNTASGGAHNHTFSYGKLTSATDPLQAIVLATQLGTGATLSSDNSSHVHAIDVPAFSGTSGSSSTANASSAHNNMQPTMLMNYIIKT
jgi:microcystin-dependent protein